MQDVLQAENILNSHLRRDLSALCPSMPVTCPPVEMKCTCVSCALSQAWPGCRKTGKNERQGKLRRGSRVKVEALRKTHGEIGLPKSMKLKPKPKPKKHRLQFKRRRQSFMCGFSLRRYWSAAYTIGL